MKVRLVHATGYIPLVEVDGVKLTHDGQETEVELPTTLRFVIEGEEAVVQLEDE